MVFRTGQRGQVEQFQDIERQFVLDDFDIPQDRFLRVSWETDDISGAGDRRRGRATSAAVSLIVRDFVLPLLGGKQVVRIDVLQPDEDAADSGLRRLFDEVRDFVALSVSTWIVNPIIGKPF